MLRLRDWTRGLGDFLQFLGWFLLACGVVLLLVWASARGGHGEIWAFGFFGLLGVALGSCSLLIAWVSRLLARRHAPGDQAV